MSNLPAQTDDRPHPIATGLTVSEIGIVRLRSTRSDLGIGSVIPSDHAFSAILQLQDFTAHRVWKDGRLDFEGGHRAGTLAITDLRDRWQCHHLSPFDNVRFRFPVTTLEAFAREIGRPQFNGLACERGIEDPVLTGLARAIVPLLDHPNQASPLFLEQMMLAMMTHVTGSYGGLFFPTKRTGLLSPWQEKRATEFLVAHADGDLSIAGLATECGLSRSYFIKAFKETTGITPHRWLMDYRVGKAKDMLLGDQPIAEIAIACGFADQSHLTRVFSASVGVSPGAWRRANRGDPVSS